MKQRIAHITDVHWMVAPKFRDLPFKRFLGSVNLFLMGRHHHFSEATQDALMRHLLELKPDGLVFSGDLTAQALDSEFIKAKTALEPVLAKTPAFLIAGNHDVYTQGAMRTKRMEKHFEDWMHWRGALQIDDSPERHIIGLHASRPHPLLASGVVPEEQLAALASHLREDPAPGVPLILTLHYPILDRRGAIYDGPKHGLRNAAALIEVLDQAARKPTVILHGHEHHGYRVDLPLTGCSVPIFDCGSSGYAHLPKLRRTGSMNVYTFSGPELVDVERYMFNGQRFEAEPGGPYASGR